MRLVKKLYRHSGESRNPVDWTPASAGVTAVCLVLLVFPVRAEAGCNPREFRDIEVSLQCVPKSGISIGLSNDDGAKVECMASKKVRNQCGPDGSITRLKAYQLWIKRLHEFEARCTKTKGAFTFEDANFVEPQDETYCRQAQPEVIINMFEEPLCNYRSVCPAITVICERSCGT